MAYFNHSFQKGWLAVGASPAAATATSAFTAGQLALVDGTTWQVDTPANIADAGHLAYIVGGNFHSSDSIGNNPGHGGYQESIKSKGINLRYLSRLGIAAPVAAAQATSELCVASDCAPCGQNLFVRIDVKGSPALRFLNHNAYAIGDSSGDAAANGGPLPGLCCIDGQEYLDPALALAAAMQMVLADPIVSPFVAEGAAAAAGVPATLENVAGTAAAYTASTTTSAIATTSSGSGTGVTVEIVTDAAGTISTVTMDQSAGAAQNYAVGETLTVLGTAIGGASPANDVTFDIASLVETGMAVTVGGTTSYYTISEVLNGTYTPSTDPLAAGAEVTACVTIKGAYVDTKFGDCSFDTRDHYGKEPVSIISSILDETGNPCNDCGVATNTPGQMGQTQGETVIRSLLMSERYMQNPFNQGNADSSRIREIEGFDPILAAVDRNINYKVYYLQHSVPRFNNPSGVFDNDQYLYEIYVDPADAAADADMAALWTAISAKAVALGNVVLVETGL